MGWSLQSQGTGWVRYAHTAISANATSSTDGIDLYGFNSISVQCIHASHSDTSTWAIKTSNNAGTNYDAYTTTATTSGAAGSTSLEKAPFAGGKVTITVTETDGNASATLTPYLVARKNR